MALVGPPYAPVVVELHPPLILSPVILSLSLVVPPLIVSSCSLVCSDNVSLSRSPVVALISPIFMLWTCSNWIISSLWVGVTMWAWLEFHHSPQSVDLKDSVAVPAMGCDLLFLFVTVEGKQVHNAV